ncbi:MAG: hypothetical protein AAFQ16_11575 [Pseudomonadota bacterium]
MRTLVLLVCSLFLQALAYAEAEDTLTTDGSLVEKPITITITGVDDMSTDTVAAINRLAAVLESIQTSSVELPDEQLAALDELIAGMTRLVEATGEAAPKLEEALLQSQTTLAEVTRGVADEVNTTVVEPSLTRLEQITQSLASVVAKARTTAYIAGALLLGLIIAILVWLGRYLAQILTALREVTGRYVLVDRAEWDRLRDLASQGISDRSKHRRMPLTPQR